MARNKHPLIKIKMDHIKHISIPQACHQSWQQMTAVNEGRHCAHCSKTVTDFTTMTNDEIIAYLSAKSNICGRFEETQLDSINRNIHVQGLSNKGWWRSAAIVLGLIGPVLSFKASGQTKPQINCTADTIKKQDRQETHIILGKVVSPDRLRFRTITGHITDDRNEVIPGAVVETLSGNIGAVTDTQGNFTLKVTLDEKQLRVRCIGYYSQMINIDNTTDTYNIDLKMREVLMGDVAVVVVRPSLPKRLYYRIIKKPIQRLFK